LLSLPNNSTPAIGLDFRPFGLIRQPPPNSLNPPILRGLDKTLHYAILRKIHLDPHGEGDSPHPAPSWSLVTQYPPPQVLTSSYAHVISNIKLRLQCPVQDRAALPIAGGGSVELPRGRRRVGKNNFY